MHVFWWENILILRILTHDTWLFSCCFQDFHFVEILRFVNVFHHISEVFYHYFFEYFSIPCFLFFLVLLFWCVWWCSMHTSGSFHLFFFLSSNWIILNYLIFKFSDYSIQICCWNLLWFFFKPRLLYYSASEFLFSSFFIISVFILHSLFVNKLFFWFPLVLYP